MKLARKYTLAQSSTAERHVHESCRCCDSPSRSATDATALFPVKPETLVSIAKELALGGKPELIPVFARSIVGSAAMAVLAAKPLPFPIIGTFSDAKRARYSDAVGLTAELYREAADPHERWIGRKPFDLKVRINDGAGPDERERLVNCVELTGHDAFLFREDGVDFEGSKGAIPAIALRAVVQNERGQVDMDVSVLPQVLEHGETVLTNADWTKLIRAVFWSCHNEVAANEARSRIIGSSRYVDPSDYLASVRNVPPRILKPIIVPAPRYLPAAVIENAPGIQADAKPVATASEAICRRPSHCKVDPAKFPPIGTGLLSLLEDEKQFNRTLSQTLARWKNDVARGGSEAYPESLSFVLRRAMIGGHKRAVSMLWMSVPVPVPQMPLVVLAAAWSRDQQTDYHLCEHLDEYARSEVLPADLLAVGSALGCTGNWQGFTTLRQATKQRLRAELTAAFCGGAILFNHPPKLRKTVNSVSRSAASNLRKLARQFGRNEWISALCRGNEEPAAAKLADAPESNGPWSEFRFEEDGLTTRDRAFAIDSLIQDFCGEVQGLSIPLRILQRIWVKPTGDEIAGWKRAPAWARESVSRSWIQQFEPLERKRKVCDRTIPLVQAMRAEGRDFVVPLSSRSLASQASSIGELMLGSYSDELLAKSILRSSIHARLADRPLPFTVVAGFHNFHRHRSYSGLKVSAAFYQESGSPRVFDPQLNKEFEVRVPDDAEAAEVSALTNSIELTDDRWAVGYLQRTGFDLSGYNGRIPAFMPHPIFRTSTRYEADFTSLTGALSFAAAKYSEADWSKLLRIVFWSLHVEHTPEDIRRLCLPRLEDGRMPNPELVCR